MNGAPFPRVIPQLLAERARASPETPAAYFRGADGDWQSCNWREFHARVARAAHGLRALGFHNGDRLAIQLGVCLEWELLRQAALAAGGVVVGIDPGAAPDQVAHMLHVARPAGVAAGDVSNLNRLCLLGPSSIRLGVTLGELKPEERVDFAGGGLSAASLRWLDRQPSEPRLSLPTPDAPATIIFTSGSTSVPKGIQFSHRQIMAACEAISQTYPELEEGDTCVCWLPLAHLYQRMVNLLSIARGMATYFVADPESLIDQLPQIQPSFFVGVPRVFEKIAADVRSEPQKSQRWRGRLKYAVTGSAPIAPEVLEFLAQHDVLTLEAYGTTENVIPIAASRKHARRFGSVGRPLPQNDLRFAPDGEILVKGPGVFHGYVGDPSRDRFTDDGYYATGDFGYLDEDGFLFLTGRKSDIIKTSTGRKIAPAKIEAVYSRAPLVGHVVVFGNGRPRLVALVTINDRRWQDQNTSGRTNGSDDYVEKVRTAVATQFAALEQSLSSYERISNFAVLDRPFSVRLGEVTPTLKIRRERIEQLHAETIETLYARAAPARQPNLSNGEPAVNASENHVLITGATGVVGGSLLPLFFDQPKTTVYLLIRATSASYLKARLRKLLEYCGIREKESVLSKRIVALRGDVARPRLGLEQELYNRLPGKLTHIVHAAGNVRLNQSLEAAQRDAVVATRQILDLARQCRAAGQLQKLEYVSTVGVSGRTAGRITETPLNPQRGFRNTYEAAKAEAEWLVLRQSDAGLPVTVHRLSMVVGDSQTGRALNFQVFYHLSGFFAGLRTGGIVPETGEVKLDIIPCDCVAGAIHHVAQNALAAGKILHHCSGPELAPTIANLTEKLRPIFNGHGYALPPLAKLPLDEFRQQLPALKELAGPSHARFFNSLPLLLDYLDDAQTFDNQQCRRLLAQTDIVVPPVDAYLKRIMAQYLITHQPPSKHTAVPPIEESTHGRVRESC